MLGGAASLAQLGKEIAPGLFATEVDYLVGAEWAQTAEDILWRRSKLGLHLPGDAGEKLSAWLDRGKAPVGSAAAA
jgi:glycerol-3-phosphate dehydrogenase